MFVRLYEAEVTVININVTWAVKSRIGKLDLLKFEKKCTA